MRLWNARLASEYISKNCTQKQPSFAHLNVDSHNWCVPVKLII